MKKVSWVSTRLIRERPIEFAITSPAIAYSIARDIMQVMSELTQEEVWVFNLDTKNNVKSVVQVYKGTSNTCNICIKDIFKAAVIEDAVAIIVVHNHPSGKVTPSPEDILVTRNLIAAGNLLDIQVLDHIVIGDNQYQSIREYGGVF